MTLSVIPISDSRVDSILKSSMSKAVYRPKKITWVNCEL